MKPAKGREARMFKNVKPAKDKEELCRCIKWGRACISKCRKHVISARDKDRSLERVENVQLVKAKRL